MSKALALMERIDKLFTACPEMGVRRMHQELITETDPLNMKRIRRLMQLMGLEAVGPKPNLSKPQPGHTIYPYLLRGVSIERVNQVWSTDITYVPMASGFLYLCRTGGFGRSAGAVPSNTNIFTYGLTLMGASCMKV